MNMVSTCQYKYERNGKVVRCSRCLYTGTHCILHDDRPQGDVKAKRQAVLDELADESKETIDFHGTRLEQCTDLFDEAVIKRPAIFDDVRCEGHIRFRNSRFLASPSFINTFFAEADFQGCSFEEDVCFGPRFKSRRLTFTDSEQGITVFRKSATFSANFGSDPLTFRNVRFDGPVRFNGSHFNGSCVFHGTENQATVFVRDVDFDGCHFSGTVLLRDVVFGGSLRFTPESLTLSPNFTNVQFLGRADLTPLMFRREPVTFRSCDLNGVRFLSLDVLCSECQFDDSTWPRKRYWTIKGRHYVADEEDDKKSEKLFRFYRKLHEHYYNQSNFGLASDFYVGFMTLKRRVVTEKLASKCVNWFYSTLSRYGESIVRPALILVLMLLSVPLVLILLGEHKYPDANYVQMLSLNLSWITLFRTDDLRPSFDTLSHAVLLLETILTWLLLGLIGLGIRRAHAPKKPV